MQSVTRRYGKIRYNSGADESQVAVLLNDFEDADRMLSRLIDASKAWRDSWRDILLTQQKLAGEFELMYQSIIGASSDYQGNVPGETPQETVDRVSRLNQQYDELKNDMMDEVGAMDHSVIRPAVDAKESIQPLKKVIKKRADKKADFERYQGKYDSIQKKTGRTDKENAALTKHGTELDRAREEYQRADDRLRETLPSLLSAVFSLLPHILAAQIMIQNNLLGQCYTQVLKYCQDEGLPAPAPATAIIMSDWEGDFVPAQQRIEALACISRGKTYRTLPKQDNLMITNGSSRERRVSGYESTQRRPSVSPARSDTSFYIAQSIPPSPNYDTKPSTNHDTRRSPSRSPDSRPRMLSVPSQGSLALAQPNYNQSAFAPNGEIMLGASPAGPKADYFSRDRISSAGSELATAAAMKKKPPPPPPKRLPSAQGIWVTALYDFQGQGQGDLIFREGDRIKVLKKTDSTDDWWEGELRGTQGAFPANYVKAY